MEIKTARFLENAANHNCSDLDVYEDYSGRGMFGRTTDGVVVDNVEQMLFDVLQYVKDNTNVRAELQNIHLSSFRIDNMGRKIILY